MSVGRKPLVVLVGFPAAGKSAIGRELEKNGARFRDLDSEIEAQLGKTAAQLIRVEGEERFRELEQQTLKKLLGENIEVLAIGAGALLREENRRLLQESGRLVALKASSRVLAERIWADERSGACIRPLVSGASIEEIEQAVSALNAQREGLYDGAAVTVWTDWCKPRLAAEAVREEMVVDAPRRKVVIPWVHDDSGAATTVVIGSGVLTELGALLKRVAPNAAQVVLVTDNRVQQLWAPRVIEALAKVELRSSLLVVESGEQSKRLAIVEMLAERMLKAGIGRSDAIVALGGGVVGDLAGLLASLYMRGVIFVQVPTTLLAQVDSALGGKTAVNLEGGKNILGSFYPAELVVSDLEVLSTLPEREFRASLAEVVKCGVIGSVGLFEWLEESAEKILGRDPETLARIVGTCTRLKIGFVHGDLKDKEGRRALLNFGHTVGHAVESLTGYGRFLHGEAVSIGMATVLRFGVELGVTPPKVMARVERLLGAFSLPVEIDFAAGSEEWARALQADKKRVSDGLNLVLVESLGGAFIRPVSIDAVVQSITRGAHVK